MSDEIHQTSASSRTSSVFAPGSLSSPSLSDSDVHGRSTRRRRFQSFRLRGEYSQPWLSDKRMNRVRHSNYIVYGFAFLAFCLSGYICFTGYQSVVTHDYCMVLDEDFKTLDTDIWSHEVQLDGFGTGTFDWTTDDPENSYITSDGLRIKPTLTNETTSITNGQISNGYALNLTTDGTCTSSTRSSCGVNSNISTGHIIPPVRSARLNTKGKKNIKYGRIEVTAKLPSGKWLWPAIWMMPENDTYGVWPKSGEIDIMEARGNAPGYILGGIDSYISSMHWGPSALADGYWRSTSSRSVRRTDFSKGFHKFGIEWSENYLFTYLDERLYYALWFGFKEKTMWQLGQFASYTDSNHSYYTDPWSSTGRKNTPFDQPFYLILNVGVGGTNGFFADGEDGKPWIDTSGIAARNFWDAADSWLPSWGKEEDWGMTVKSVKMWQQGKC